MIFPGDGAKQQHHYRHFPATAWFEYHCWESDRSADAKLWRRTQQRIQVLRMLTPEESDYEMYAIRFVDGFEGIAFADELVRSPKFFTRRGGASSTSV